VAVAIEVWLCHASGFGQETGCYGVAVALPLAVALVVAATAVPVG